MFLQEKTIAACMRYSGLQRGHVVAVLFCPDLLDAVQALVDKAREVERERCAKIADDDPSRDPGSTIMCETPGERIVAAGTERKEREDNG